MAEVGIGKTIPFTVQFFDAGNNPTKPIGLPTVTQANPTADTLSVDALTGLFGSCVGLAPGVDTLTVTDPGSGVTGTSEVLTVVAGAPATATITFGVPLP